ncbi:hypothetical protein HG530_008056 [Fusarium avenaceum]|nr:hypothetical protein HG530_008056 [Fusarium avenaceum]
MGEIHSRLHEDQLTTGTKECLDVFQDGVDTRRSVENVGSDEDISESSSRAAGKNPGEISVKSTGTNLDDLHVGVQTTQLAHVGGNLRNTANIATFQVESTQQAVLVQDGQGIIKRRGPVDTNISSSVVELLGWDVLGVRRQIETDGNNTVVILGGRLRLGDDLHKTTDMLDPSVVGRCAEDTELLPLLRRLPCRYSLGPKRQADLQVGLAVLHDQRLGEGDVAENKLINRRLRILRSGVLTCRLEDHGEVCRGWEDGLSLDNVATQPGDVFQVEEAAPSGLLRVVVMDERTQEFMGKELAMLVRSGHPTLVPVCLRVVEWIRGEIRQELGCCSETSIGLPEGDGGLVQVQRLEHLQHAELRVLAALKRASIVNLGRLSRPSPQSLFDGTFQLEMRSQFKNDHGAGLALVFLSHFASQATTVIRRSHGILERDGFSAVRGSNLTARVAYHSSWNHSKIFEGVHERDLNRRGHWLCPLHAGCESWPCTKQGLAHARILGTLAAENEANARACLEIATGDGLARQFGDLRKQIIQIRGNESDSVLHNSPPAEGVCQAV